MHANYDVEIELVPPENETPVTSRSERAVTEVGLLPLEGTPHDIAAASRIRTRMLMAADDYLSKLRTDQVLTGESKDTDITILTPVSRSQVAAAQVALNRLRHKTEARWWLERPSDTIEELLAEVGTESS